MSDEQLQESATSEPQTNAREQELLKSIEALERLIKNVEAALSAAGLDWQAKC